MNANWPEITSNLLPGQTAYDRPDFCCRVFKMKLEEILAELKSCKVFGPYLAHLGVIEFNKEAIHTRFWYIRSKRRASTYERDGQMGVGAKSRREYC